VERRRAAAVAAAAATTAMVAWRPLKAAQGYFSYLHKRRRVYREIISDRAIVSRSKELQHGA